MTGKTALVTRISPKTFASNRWRMDSSFVSSKFSSNGHVVLLLDQMKDISIKQDGNGNGINSDEVFWVKQNIIDREDLRLSVDEEIVGDLSGAMVAETIPPSRVSVLDAYYYLNMEEQDGRGYKTEQAIQVRGREVISNQFLYIIDEI